jgi:Fe-S oxidoreductase
METTVRELEYCTYCPKMCRHVCPVSNAIGNETLIPQAKMQLMNMLRRGAIPFERDYVAPLYGCTACRLCTEVCTHGNVPATTLELGRTWAESRRLTHPKLARLPERFRERGERLLAKLHQEFSAHLFADEAQVAYFPGCDAIADGIDDIRAAFTVFDSLGLNFVRLMTAPHACAGYPLWTAGQHDAARFVAEDMVRALSRYATVIVGCAACTHLLRERLPALGYRYETEIVHLSEFLYVHAERLDIQRRRPAAFYHDPCYLGRYLGIYDPPRRLLARCVESQREFFYAREEAECCGGGGLVPHTFPAAAAGQADRRLEEAELYGVPLVVSACPTCKRTLARSERARGGRVEVVDLIGLLAWALHDPDRPALPVHP